jgi:hypothetical protein
VLDLVLEKRILSDGTATLTDPERLKAQFFGDRCSLFHLSAVQQISLKPAR